MVLENRQLALDVSSGVSWFSVSLMEEPEIERNEKIRLQHVATNAERYLGLLPSYETE